MSIPSFDQLIMKIFSHDLNSLALQGDTWQVSYGELSALVDQCLQGFSCHKLAHGECVAIYGEDPRVIVAGMIAAGIWHSPFVCIDPKFPDVRIQHMLNKGQARLLLTNMHSSRKFEVSEYPLSLDAELSAGPATKLDSLCTIDCKKGATIETQTPAYFVFTSGTTGLPKGIAISRYSLAQQAMAAVDFYHIKPQECALSVLSCSSDAFIQQVFKNLISGATLCFSKKTIFDPEVLASHCIAQQINYIDLAPSVFLGLLEHAKAPQWIKQLRFKAIVLGGEELNHNIIKHWEAYGLFSKWRLVNEYGPSEATVTSCLHEITRLDLKRERTPIGLASQGTELLILDDEDLPNEEGELLIGGEGLAIGYLNDEAKTAEKFIYYRIDGQTRRYYRTGDWVKRCNQGLITFLGRIDNQVNILGQRIELEGIESVLNGQPEISESAVLCEAHALVAFIVADPCLDLSKLQSSMRKQLPAYMIPNHIEVCEGLPHTPVGKIDKQALKPKVAACLEKKSAKAVSSLNEVIALCLNISIADLNPKCSFKEHGGDSLKALAVQMKAKEIGVNLSIATLLSDEKLGSLSTSEQEKLSYSPDLLNYSLPNKFALLGLKDIEKWGICISVFAKQNVSLKRLKQLSHILRMKHPALSLTFFLEPLGQQLSKEVFVSETSLSCVSMEDFKIQVEQEFKASTEGLHLEKQLWMLRSYHSDFGQIICFSLNHLLVDDLSMMVLFDSLKSLLSSPSTFSRTRDLGLFHWQKQLVERTKSGYFDKDINYWQKVIDHDSSFINEAIHKADTIKTPQPIQKTIDYCSKETFTTLSKALVQQKLELKSLIYAALIQAYSSLTGDKRVVIAEEGNGRRPLEGFVDVGQSIGWFASATPILLNRANSIATQLATTQNDLSDHPLGGHGFSHLICFKGDEAFKSKAMAKTPRLSVTFDNKELLGLADLFSFPDHDVEPIELTGEEALFEFTGQYFWLQLRFCESQKTGLSLQLSSDGNIVSTSWIEKFAQTFSRVFNVFLDHLNHSKQLEETVN